MLCDAVGQQNEYGISILDWGILNTLGSSWLRAAYSDNISFQIRNMIASPR